MKTVKLVAAISLLLGLFTLVSSAQSVQSDFDRSANLAKLKTFTFAAEVQSDNKVSSTDVLNDQRITTALERELSVNGYIRNDDGRADFTVTYVVSSRNRFSLREYNYGPLRAGNRDINVDPYTEGTLIVDIIDTATKQVVWRGRASGAVELKSVDKKIGKAVHKLVEQFVKDVKTRG